MLDLILFLSLSEDHNTWEKLTLGGHFITNSLVAESSLSIYRDVQHANVPKEDIGEYPRMFLKNNR